MAVVPLSPTVFLLALLGALATGIVAGFFLRRMLDGPRLPKEDPELDHLVEVTEQLSQAYEDMEQFAYMASHDLQEPIRDVSNFFNIVWEDYQEAIYNSYNVDSSKFPPEKAKEYIFGGLHHMSSLIKDLLRFSRTNNSFSFERDVPLADLLERGKFSLNGRFIYSGAEVTVEDELPSIDCDPQFVVQVFANLFSNSVKFAKEGERPKIRVRVMPDEESVVHLVVEDYGIGIPKGYAEKALEPFQRLHAREAYDGSGIGLAIVNRIVKKHSGRFWLESEGRGKGTRAHVVLPKKQKDEEDIGS